MNAAHVRSCHMSVTVLFFWVFMRHIAMCCILQFVSLSLQLGVQGSLWVQLNNLLCNPLRLFIELSTT